MENNPQFDRELLSGYLDDALNSSERQQAEMLLANEPAAARYLEALRSTRETLRSVAPTRLRTDFSKRVIELARQQAVAEQLPAQHHLMLSESSQVRLAADQTVDSTNSTARSTSGARWAWAVSAVLAASVLWIAVAVYRHEPEQVPLAVGNDTPEVTHQEVINQAEQPPAPQLAEALPSAASQNMTGRNTAGLSIPGGDESALPMNSNPPPVAVRNNSAQALKPEPDGSLMVLDVLFVMDVVMASDAWDEGRFDKLLSRHGLPITKAIRADKELLGAIVESRMVVGPDDATADEKRAAAKSEIALIFVQCKVTDLERIAIEIENDKQSYSDLTYDIGLDDKRMVLARLLKQSAGKPSGKGDAKMIVPDNSGESVSGLFPAFVGFAKEPQPLRVAPNLIDSRTPFKGMGMLDSEVLIVLRKQAP